MEEKNKPSKAQIVKMVIDQMTPEEKEELQKLVMVDMAKNNELPVKNKLELQVG